MLTAVFASAFMVLLSVSIHYEGLQLISRALARITLVGRRAMIVSITGVFLLHTIEVLLYALAYMLLETTAGSGFRGQFSGALDDYVYFSATSYTSLGLGDVYPVGGMRLITGVEALNGLVLIGWSASYSYLVMERLWGFPGGHGGRARLD